MIQKFVDIFMSRKADLEATFATRHPDDYIDVVRRVIALFDDGRYGSPSVDRIHEINDGDYQGTLVFIIADGGYQPSDYWYVMVDYGSCSGCDTLQGIRCYTDAAPDKEQVKEYMTLALHIVQGLKKMGRGHE